MLAPQALSQLAQVGVDGGRVLAGLELRSKRPRKKAFLDEAHRPLPHGACTDGGGCRRHQRKFVNPRNQQFHQPRDDLVGPLRATATVSYRTLLQDF
jgi:hypothetical protein